MDEKIFTIAEASQFLRVGRSRVYELLGEGHLHAIRIGRRTIIKASEIDRFLKSLPTYAPDSNLKHQK